MSDSFPYSGASAAEASRYALNEDKIAVICIQSDGLRTCQPSCNLHLPSIRGQLSAMQSRQWSDRGDRKCFFYNKKKRGRARISPGAGIRLGRERLAWSNAAKKVQKPKQTNTTGRLFLGRTWVSPSFQAAPGLAFFSPAWTRGAGVDWG